MVCYVVLKERTGGKAIFPLEVSGSRARRLASLAGKVHFKQPLGGWILGPFCAGVKHLR